jgi:type IV pilus assembly protein PilB
MNSTPLKKPSTPGANKATPEAVKKNNGVAPTLDNIVEKMVADEAKINVAAANQPTKADDADAQAPVVMLVHTLLREALRRGASDIHIEPFEDILRVRFRVDGALIEIQQLPIKLIGAIVSRLKIMAELDICERRIPQDGSIRLRGQNGEEADFRMSTLPSVFGEKVVMRVLGKSNLNNDLAKVGLPEKQLDLLRTAINKPDGLVLVTGPTGSGKTTTLYACLTELNDPSSSIFTAEDPVEGTIKGITQVQINNAVGLTFSTVLRSLLRQDPDIILVGEIRDKETIEIAIKAALTGHLVLSTLHTNDTAATVQRLMNMGVEPYLIASAVNLIVAQRLVRKICEHCKEKAKIDLDVLKKYEIDPSQLHAGIYKGVGCKECANSGYKGRMPIYEIMNMTESLKEMVLKGFSSIELKRQARLQGMISLREAAIELLKQGITSLDEVLSKTNADSDSSSSGNSANLDVDKTEDGAIASDNWSSGVESGVM